MDAIYGQVDLSSRHHALSPRKLPYRKSPANFTGIINISSWLQELYPHDTPHPEGDNGVI